MKKLILTLLAVVSMSLAAMAGTLGSRAMFQGDHKTVNMNPDGSCFFDSRSTGRINGTYNANGAVEPGCSNVRVDFNFGGQAVTGTLMWPTQEGLKLYFDGSLLNRVL